MSPGFAPDPDRRARCALIACGALAREISALRRANGWAGLTVRYLPAELHNRPERLPEAMRRAIAGLRPTHARIFAAYGDCGTGERLDAVLRAEGVERLPGAHCYEFLAGGPAFAALAQAEPGTFFVTDFLARHFERLVVRGLGIDRHPELLGMYFGNYRRLVYLAQSADPQARAKLRALARDAADRLGLAFEELDTGYGELRSSLIRWMTPARDPVEAAPCPS